MICTNKRRSGLLKSKELEVQQLYTEALDRLRQFQQVFHEGIAVVKRVSRDLKASETRISQLKARVSRQFPVEYAQARERVVDRNVVLDGEDIYI